METTGKLTGVTVDIMTRKLNVTFQIDTQPIDDLNELQKLESLDIVAKKHRKKPGCEQLFPCTCRKDCGCDEYLQDQMQEHHDWQIWSARIFG